MPKRDRPTLTVNRTIEAGGILWEPDISLNWEWYYHNNEDKVFPRDCAHRLHTGHAVTPSSRPPSSRPPSEPEVYRTMPEPCIYEPDYYADMMADMEAIEVPDLGDELTQQSLRRPIVQNHGCCDAKGGARCRGRRPRNPHGGKHKGKK